MKKSWKWKIGPERKIIVPNRWCHPRNHDSFRDLGPWGTCFDSQKKPDDTPSITQHHLHWDANRETIVPLPHEKAQDLAA